MNVLLILIIILAAILFWILAYKTDLLRDPRTCSTPDQRNTFSLSRVQLGVWTLIVFCTFVFLLTTYNGNPIDIEFTESVAILLAISAGTTVLGRSIDNQPTTPGVKKPTTANGCSKGFLIDILSDPNGVSVHRFQQVLFTILLIYVFIYSTIEVKNFPEIDGYLLVLSGISSGGYLGIKISER